MRPQEALRRTIALGCCMPRSMASRSGPLYAPGAVVAKSGEEVRAALQQLTGTTASDVRDEEVAAIVGPLSLADRIARRR